MCPSPDSEIIKDLSSPMIGLTPCGVIGCAIYVTIQWPVGTVGGPIGMGPRSYVSDSGRVQQRKRTLSTYLEMSSKQTIQSSFEYSRSETYPVHL